MQHVRSSSAEPPRSSWRVPAFTATMLVLACATGVDVTDGEFEEICSDPNVDCGDGAPVAGTGGSNPVGNVGGSSSNLGGSTSGSFNGGGGGNAGTSSGSGGSVSQGGSSGNPPPPLAEGDCLPTNEVVITYTDRLSEGPSANQASMTLSVRNEGPTFNLPDLTMRYWFTDDDVADFTGCTDCANVDYAQQSGGMDIRSSVTVTFGEEFGSNYAEIGFSAGNPVEPQGVVQEVQIRLHTSSYQTLNQANDFSFLDNVTGVPNPNVTPYVNGVQVGGCVPIPP